MGKVDSPMQMIVIMEAFGWSYDDYMATPHHVIHLIKEKLVRDGKERELALKQAKRGK